MLMYVDLSSKLFSRFEDQCVNDGMSKVETYIYEICNGVYKNRITSFRATEYNQVLQTSLCRPLSRYVTILVMFSFPTVMNANTHSAGIRLLFRAASVWLQWAGMEQYQDYHTVIKVYGGTHFRCMDIFANGLRPLDNIDKQCCPKAHTSCITTYI